VGILNGEKPLKVHVGILLVIVAYFKSGGPKKLTVSFHLAHVVTLDVKFSIVKSAKAVLLFPKKNKKVKQINICENLFTIFSRQ